MISSIIDIPFDYELFGVLVCMTVLHELRGKIDRIRAFQEVYRVFKSDDLFFITEVDRKSSFLNSRLVAFTFHSRKFYENQVSKYGFSVIKTHKRGHIIESIAKKAIKSNE